MAAVQEVAVSARPGGALLNGLRDHPLLRHAALVPVLALWLVIALLGIDFGKHWDEVEILNVAVGMFRDRRLTPDFYIYPSFMFELIDLASLPDQLAEAGQGLASGALSFRLRAVCILFVSLSLLCAYGLSYACFRRRDQALLTALVLAASWEFGYHARWIATDALIATWATLSLWLLCLGLEKSSWRWLLLGAAAAGCATSTKYPAGILALSVTVAACFFPTRSLMGKAKWVVLAGVAFVAGYLLISPGTLINHERFVKDITFMMNHYSAGQHHGHRIDAGLPHAARMVEYLIVAALSPLRLLSVVGFGFALGAAITLCRGRPRVGLILCSTFALVGYMSLQRVFIVRNVIWLLPLLSMLCAHGMVLAWERASEYLRTRRGWHLTSPVAALLVALFVVPSLVFDLRAALSIYRPVDMAVAFRSALGKIERRDLQVSPGIAAVLGLPDPSDLSFDPARPARVVVALSSELAASPFMPSRPDLLLGWIGPQEVNLNYYPTWIGREHVVWLSQQRMIELMEHQRRLIEAMQVGG